MISKAYVSFVKICRHLYLWLYLNMIYNTSQSLSFIDQFIASKTFKAMILLVFILNRLIALRVSLCLSLSLLLLGLCGSRDPNIDCIDFLLTNGLLLYD